MSFVRVSSSSDCWERKGERREGKREEREREREREREGGRRECMQAMPLQLTLKRLMTWLCGLGPRYRVCIKSR